MILTILDSQVLAIQVLKSSVKLSSLTIEVYIQ